MIDEGHAEPDAISSPLLELEGIDVRFGGIRALERVSLQVRRGEILGLIGPNGAGKTTLFDVISGVRQPAAGQVRLDGNDVTRRSTTARARLGVRRTFQRVQTFGWLTVEDNVLAAAEWRGGGGGFAADMIYFPTRRRREKQRRARAQDVLESCGLLAVKDELASSLPIAIGRMVELARATVEDPRLLLLDEPASGLDDAEAARLAERIHAVRDATGCSVILVEHNAGFVMEHSDRVVVMDQGSVLATGSPQQIQNNAAVRRAYLGEAVTAGDS